ncbi:MAG: fatty acid desaturase [Verrucomicrobia bacterium]|nr:fatty acid desaturase [Verrucomicrobiota bacterium]
MTDSHPIPARLNLVIALSQMIVLLGLLWLSASVEGWWLLAVALGYGLVMNSAYAMLHEAEHGLLHPDRGVNDLTGVVLALFFPAPFHLIRQGHIGHHMRNRSDDEAFDFYFDGESRVWKYLQLYGILTGLFWLVIVFSNVLAALAPRILRPNSVKFDRSSVALMESLNPRWMPLVRIEAISAILLHGGLIWLWQIPIMHWFATLAGFGVIWSAMQYVHHFGTERDVMNGAKNLRTWRWLDALWLNHNWHLRHHRHPTVSWIYLPQLDEGPQSRRPHLLPSYLRMWRGPRLTHERIENRHAGKIIR